MTRPTKLTPETANRIADALRVGATRKDAVLSAGVSYPTFFAWLERGKASGRGIYAEFLNLVEQAEAEARLRFTKVITRAAAEGDWRAAEAFLKRRDREHWGDEPAQKQTEPIQIEIIYKRMSENENND